MVSGVDVKSGFNRKLKMGMVGGGRGAFIGAVHRMAATLDNGVEFTAGALSSTPEKSKLSGQDYYLDPGRVYANYREMIDKEKSLPEGVKIDFVSVVTPNNTHFEIARAFLEAGFNVICDKPMTFNLKEALELRDAVKKSGRVFALTHNYTGFPMVKQARSMVKNGKLGKINKVVVEYPQGWLLAPIERDGQKQAAWRTDPKQAGASCCIGDIGTHCENLANYITGLEIDELCADFTTFIKGRPLEDDGNILLHFKGGARGILYASQISTGEENGLYIRIYGEKAALKWREEDPNYLYVFYPDKPFEVYKPGNGYACAEAQKNTRLPAGHPEGFIEAFANIYRNATDTMRAKMAGRKPAEIELDFPDVNDGVRGMAFIETAVKSAKSSEKWVKMPTV